MKKIDNTSRSTLNILYGLGFIAILLFIISIIIFNQRFSGYLTIAILILLVSMVLFIGALSLLAVVNTEERQIKRIIVDIKYNLKRKFKYVNKLEKNSKTDINSTNKETVE